MILLPSSPVLSEPIFFQDTVVALQALSKYGAATFTKREKAATVTIKSSETFSEEFQVDEGNRLLLQEVALPEVPGEYSMAVSGSGCVYLQVRLPGFRRCHKWENKSQKFHLNFKIEKETCPKGRYKSRRRDRLFECKNKGFFFQFVLDIPEI